MKKEYSLKNTPDGVIISSECFDATLTLDCGQAFRWTVSGNGDISGMAGNRFLEIRPCDGGYLFSGVTEEQFETFWKHYFDFERSYSEICGTMAADPSLRKALDFCPGIRILRQEPWEALCSFIISQNNNIPRIKGIVERLCSLLGEKDDSGHSAFPSASAVLEAGVDGLAPIRAGFRAKYIISAAQSVVSGETDFSLISSLPLADAEKELCRIKGVGPKVAQCVLLYGLGRCDAFPVDVWVKRIMEELYPSGMPGCTKGFEGIAQQYLFHAKRNGKI